MDESTAGGGSTVESRGLPARLVRLRIRGFRSYGTEVREIDLDSPLTIIKGDNSQGKTATAEALEFLFTGSSSRRELFGGAKAEYSRMLANVHLVDGDSDVWVEADVRGPDGVVRTVRRTLDTDYSQTDPCTSTLTIDAAPGDLAALGIPLGEPPLAAPVLLQHNLRYVLSTEPQKRAEYFRALLELNDLDIVRRALARAKSRVASLAPLPRIVELTTLINAVQQNPVAAAAVREARRGGDSASVVANLTSAARAAVPTVTAADSGQVIAELRAVRARAEERIFPIGALTPSTTDDPPVVRLAPLVASIGTYNERLAQVDAEVARLTPLFNAVLAHPHLGSLTEPATCPLCADGVLRPERIAELRRKLAASVGLEQTVAAVLTQLRSVVEVDVDNLGRFCRSFLPEAVAWDEARWSEVAAHRVALGSSTSSLFGDLASEDSVRGMVLRSANLLGRLREVRGQAKAWTDEAIRQVAARAPIAGDPAAQLTEVVNLAGQMQQAAVALSEFATSLHQELGEKLQSAVLPPGTREVLDILEHADEVYRELRMDRQRTLTERRIDNAQKAIEEAEQKLLDARFDDMGAEIDRWWATLRPEELVRFGGVGRRASGRRYVNLTAELAISPADTPEKRDAVGVFSDSQLNALALSAFLARQRLLKSPVVVLDDPLPGYDAEHSVTFAVDTVGALLREDVQVILCTYDSKLAVNLNELNAHRGAVRYELTLSDMVEGTAVTNQTDVFGRHVLEAQDAIGSLTEEGRRNAATALRRAAERLAKQIIATGRTRAGAATRVSEIEDKILGELVPDVLGFALANDERGRWTLWKSTLNPGPHDSIEVPSTAALRTVLGDIKKLKKDHESHWPGGLLA
jgi:hypothetical protein